MISIPKQILIVAVLLLIGSVATTIRAQPCNLGDRNFGRDECGSGSLYCGSPEDIVCEIDRCGPCNNYYGYLYSCVGFDYLCFYPGCNNCQ